MKVLTPRQLRRMGNCPPPTRRQLQAQPSNLAPAGTTSRRAGQQRRQVRVLSWNAEHLGQREWSEIKTWLAIEADKHCDVLILQETHWTASAEFTVSGWYCVSSASPLDSSRQTLPAQRGRRKTRKNPEEGPSATVADGVQGRVLEVRADCDGSRIVIAAIYQHVWSTAKTLQAVYFRP